MTDSMPKSAVNVKVIVSEYGKDDVLRVVNEPLRAPAAGELRIRVQAAGVALADVMRREGVYPAAPKPPFTPGYDVVGVVDAVGEGVAGWAVGQ
jgi:NADPH:quinone reductase-like Zn-dependent oxidoreductase